MKKTLYSRLIRAFLCYGLIGFLLITIAGSFLLERYLIHSISSTLYQEVNAIATWDTMTYNVSTENISDLQRLFDVFSDFHSTDIWLINNQNEIILNTADSSHEIVTLKDFNPAEWGGNYYQIGNFYGYFSSPRLSIISPVTVNMNTKGYIAIHYDMQDLYQTRTQLLAIFHRVFLIFYIFSFFLLLIYRKWVHFPVQKILEGARQYASGNLSYKIPLSGSDELGYLANTLNYLADKTNRNSEYQRTFISNISHDFRSPLTSIKGYVEAILDGTIPVEMQEKYLKIIAHEADRLEKLTRSLLTLNDLDVQKRMMHMTTFDINDTIKTTSATFEGICTTRKIRLELILSGKELPVFADMEQIQQVLYNLLDNAIKFSPDNSSIEIETTERGGKVFVSVRDHGIGIPKESLSKIWDRFYKTDTSRGKDRKGTGLGLAIVKEIINAHDQNINVISTVGIGTEFIFTLSKK